MVLELQNITMQFGGVKAIDDLSFGVKTGEIYGLIGPNGAGKTTLFNIVTGNYIQTKGKVTFNHEELSGLKPNMIVRRGIARTFQNIRLFKSMNVLDNVLIGFHNQANYTYFESILRLPRYFLYEKKLKSDAMDILERFGIAEYALTNAASLSYGNQRKVEIARALATNPKLLLLDEPAAGMNPNETEDLSQIIKNIKNEYGLTILLIEHDMKFVNNMCDKVLVLDYGEEIFEGKPSDAIVDEKVVAAYLGDFKNA